MRCCERDGSKAYSPNLIVQPSAHSKLLQHRHGSGRGHQLQHCVQVLLLLLGLAQAPAAAAGAGVKGQAAQPAHAAHWHMTVVERQQPCMHIRAQQGAHSMRVQYITPRTSMPSLTARSSCSRQNGLGEVIQRNAGAISSCGCSCCAVQARRLASFAEASASKLLLACGDRAEERVRACC